MQDDSKRMWVCSYQQFSFSNGIVFFVADAQLKTAEAILQLSRIRCGISCTEIRVGLKKITRI